MTIQIDRDTALRDAAYFAGELSRCLETLVDLERSGRMHTIWQQASALVRRVRGVLRKTIDADRSARKAAIAR